MAKKKTAVRKLTSIKAKAAGKASPKKKAVAKGRTVVAKKSTPSKVKAASGKPRTAKAGTPKKVNKPAAKPTKAVKTVKVSGVKGKKGAPVKKTAVRTAVKTTKVTKGATKPMTKKAPAKVAKKTAPSTKKATTVAKKAVKASATKVAAPVVSRTKASATPAATKVPKATAGTPAAVAKNGPEAGPKPATKAAAPPVKAPMPPVVAPPKAVAKVAEGPKRPAKERVQIEFMVRSAPAVLFDLISTPSGFSEWYCSDVNMKGDQYTFIWPDEEESTTMIGRRLGEVVRFRRNDEEDENAYFEFRIRIDAMTNEVALIVTDHAWPDEVEETRNLWSSQIASLIRVLGA